MNLFLLKKLNESFSLKLFALFGFFVLIIFASFTFMFLDLEGKSLNETLEKDGELLANILARNIRIGVFSENEALLKDPVESIFEKKDILSIAIYNQDGKLLKNKIRESSKKLKDLPQHNKEKAESFFLKMKGSGKTIIIKEKNRLFFWTPIYSRYDNSLKGTVYSEISPDQSENPLIGYLNVTIGKERLNKQLNRLFLRSILIAAIIFIAGSILTYSIMKKFTKPLDRLTDAVKSFGAGNIIDKVHLETDDEIGKLANAFNNMADSIKWREDALKTSEIKYRKLFQESRDIIFIIDAEWKFTDANQTALELFGYSREEILKIGLSNLFNNNNDFKNIKDFLAENPYAIDKETKLKNSMGKQLDCLITLSVRKNQRGTLIGYQGIIRDVTHQKILENQLQQAQRMEAIGTLAGGIAHDFNNILSPIMLHTEMVMDDLTPDDPLQINMKEIFKAASRARDLVKQILTFARKRPDEKIVIKSSLIVKEVIKFIRSTIPTTIDLKFKNDAEQDTILADPTQLNRIVMNLCTNAAFAMKEHGGLLEVSLENEDVTDEAANPLFILKQGKYIKLSVKDNGTGISPKIMDRIFEPYFTTKKFGEGTGLGLATIHGIVKSYGGYISVESEPGKGTVFYIYLPIVEMERLKNVEKDSFISTGTERILFVDDDKLAGDSIKEILERLGYKVTARTSSIEALEAFRNSPESFDIVITDMTMPNLTGKELSDEIKKIRKDIPVILCTGFSDQINPQKAKELGISAFIMKPVLRNKMANTIREVLDKNNSSPRPL